MGYYKDRADFEGNIRHIINNQTNLATVAGSVNTMPGAGLIASQGDISTVLRQIAGLTAAVQALAGEGGDKITSIIREAVESTASHYYVKSAEDDSVYALDVATGTLRPVSLAEWNVAEPAGFNVTVVEENVIQNAPR